MKLVTPTETPTTFFLPLRDVLAVWNATPTEKTRYYLNGVYVEQHDRDGIQLIATDGHILLRKTCAPEAFMGADVSMQARQFDRGFILALDTTDKACKAKSVGEAWIYGDTETGIIQVLDVCGEVKDGYRRLGVVEFDRIDGTFPDWRRVLPKVTPGKGVGPVCCDLALLARFQSASKVFGSKPWARITSAKPGDPMLVEFGSACEGMTGVLMPARWGNC